MSLSQCFCTKKQWALRARLSYARQVALGFQAGQSTSVAREPSRRTHWYSISQLLLTLACLQVQALPLSYLLLESLSPFDSNLYICIYIYIYIYISSSFNNFLSPVLMDNVYNFCYIMRVYCLDHHCPYCTERFKAKDVLYDHLSYNHSAKAC